MQEVITLSERGVFTLPASVRSAFGLRGGQQFMVNISDGGKIILQPAVLMPIEHYSESRIADFASEEAQVSSWLKKNKKRKRRK